MKIKKICLLGGTGFVGHYIVAKLAKLPVKIYILTRKIARHRDLLVLPNIELIEADVYDENILKKHFNNMDAVINLIGILNEKGKDGTGFNRVHFELTQKILKVCEEQGVKHLLQMSALNADIQGKSFYLQSKGKAEEYLKQIAKNTAITIFRPSVIFGSEDSFLNRFADLLKILPLVFPLACANAKFAPVYVGDIADNFVEALGNSKAFGQSYDLCGPKEYTLQELVEYVGYLQDTNHLILPLNNYLSYLQASIFEFIPGKPLSIDNYKSLQVDSICSDCVIKQPTALEAIAPTYIKR